VLPDYFAPFPKACLNGWGRVFLTVAADGTVLPCQTAREIRGLKFENARRRSLAEIWFESEAFQKFRGTGWLPEPCQSCPRKEQDFGGCRCQAFLLTGEATATDPVCSLAPRHHLIADALAEADAGAPGQLIYRNAVESRRFQSEINALTFPPV
jgi:pyrroloquinoline quinone biosynthesis protein E